MTYLVLHWRKHFPDIIYKLDVAYIRAGVGLHFCFVLQMFCLEGDVCGHVCVSRSKHDGYKAG
jgi:hypothetical protein